MLVKNVKYIIRAVDHRIIYSIDFTKDFHTLNHICLASPLVLVVVNVVMEFVR